MTQQSDSNGIGRSKAYWVAAGERAILALLESEHAVVRREIESRISEKPGTSRHIQPHILADSLKRMQKKGLVIASSQPSRGGRTLETFSLASPAASARTVERAAGRKRLLLARYLQWANGTPGQGRHTGIVGASLERSLHSSMMESAPYVGYRVINPSGGKVNALWDMNFHALGATDNGFTWTEEIGGRKFVGLVEAKNLREWIYPWSPELFQLLYKAAFLHQDFADRGYEVLPVLVCRKASKTLFYAAKDLGFHVVMVGKQIIDFGNSEASEDERLVNEVRSELGFLDIIDHKGTHPAISKQFQSVLPSRSVEVAERFSQIGSKLQIDFQLLRTEGSNQRKYRNLKTKAKQYGADVSSW